MAGATAAAWFRATKPRPLVAAHGISSHLFVDSLVSQGWFRNFARLSLVLTALQRLARRQRRQVVADDSFRRDRKKYDHHP